MRNEGVDAFCGKIGTFSEWNKLVFTAVSIEKSEIWSSICVTNRFSHWKGRKKSKRCKKTFKYVNLILSKGKKWVLLDYKPFLDRFLQGWLIKWSKFLQKLDRTFFNFDSILHHQNILPAHHLAVLRVFIDHLYILISFLNETNTIIMCKHEVFPFFHHLPPILTTHNSTCSSLHHN